MVGVLGGLVVSVVFEKNMLMYVVNVSNCCIVFIFIFRFVLLICWFGGLVLYCFGLFYCVRI